MPGRNRKSLVVFLLIVISAAIVYVAGYPARLPHVLKGDNIQVVAIKGDADRVAAPGWISSPRGGA
jgi:hypothetical protein